MMDGILLVDKPSGMTSHDVIAIARKKLNIRKIGHTGTLDPFATGLLILLIGKATKLSFLFDQLNKAYTGTIVFGKHFDTYDTTGKIIDEKEPYFNIEQLKQEMQSFIPAYNQIPPMYSAIKKEGKKMVDLARQGKKIELDPRTISVYQFDLISFENKQADFYAHVSKGAYIRSLAYDLGQKLNTYGALSSLRRLKIGDYDVKQAYDLDHLTLGNVINHKDLFEKTKQVILNDYMIRLVKNGVYLDERQTHLDEPFIVLNQEGEYVAYYVPKDNQYQPIYFF